MQIRQRKTINHSNYQQTELFTFYKISVETNANFFSRRIAL